MHPDQCPCGTAPRLHNVVHRVENNGLITLGTGLTRLNWGRERTFGLLNAVQTRWHKLQLLSRTHQVDAFWQCKSPKVWARGCAGALGGRVERGSSDWLLFIQGTTSRRGLEPSLGLCKLGYPQKKVNGVW